jgi:hypothetical protein
MDLNFEKRPPARGLQGWGVSTRASTTDLNSEVPEVDVPEVEVPEVAPGARETTPSAVELERPSKHFSSA